MKDCNLLPKFIRDGVEKQDLENKCIALISKYLISYIMLAHKECRACMF